MSTPWPGLGSGCGATERGGEAVDPLKALAVAEASKRRDIISDIQGLIYSAATEDAVTRTIRFALQVRHLQEAVVAYVRPTPALLCFDATKSKRRRQLNGFVYKTTRNGTAVGHNVFRAPAGSLSGLSLARTTSPGLKPGYLLSDHFLFGELSDLSLARASIKIKNTLSLFIVSLVLA